MLLLPSGVVASASEWEKVSDKAGVLIERRAIPGTHLFEVRATVHSTLPPGAIFDTLWNHREYPQFIPHLKRLDLLSDTDDEHLVYEQVAVPLARDRDYTVRLRKQVDAAAQRYGIRFETANDAGPPPDGGHVRVSSIEGGWSIKLGADGKGSRGPLRRADGARRDYSHLRDQSGPAGSGGGSRARRAQASGAEIKSLPTR